MNGLADKSIRFLALSAIASLFLGAGGCSSTHAPVLAVPAEAPQSTVPTSDNPVTAVAWLTPQSIRPGGNLELRVRIQVAASYHLYAAGTGPPFTPTTVKLISCDELLAIGAWKVSDADAHGQLANVIDFSQQLHVVPNIALGAHDVSCDLTYQACNPELCWPPQRLRLHASFELTE